MKIVFRGLYCSDKNKLVGRPIALNFEGIPLGTVPCHKGGWSHGQATQGVPTERDVYSRVRPLDISNAVGDKRRVKYSVDALIRKDICR